MNCSECNFYCNERRVCIKTQKFEFPSMPVCKDFINEKEVNLQY